MQKFMIEKLRVSGAGKIDGVVNFTDGLNIIQGRSNTGKTWILKCIYYLFSSDTRPYSPLTGYTDIEGTFLTERYGRIKISRTLDEEKAIVEAESEEVENGEYDTNYKKDNSRYLNDLWLRIIGLNETIEVPKTARYARERMSWTNIASVFFADENEIDKSESLVIKDSRYETPLIASLYFLLTGDYKKGVPEITKPEVATAKKKAVVDYIDEQVAALTEKRISYIMQLEELEGTDIDKEMQELSERIQEVQQEIKDLMEENTAIVRQVAEYQQEDANCRVLVDRYESLISQYKADLQRLDFISKGEQAVKDLPSNGVCPFCGGELHPDDDDSYIEAINAEIKRIASELAIIVATEDSVQDEQKTIQKSIKELQERRSEISAALDEKNQEIQNCRYNMQQFKDYTTLQNGIDFVNDQLAILGDKKVSELKKKKNPPLYHAKQEFEEEVGTGFNTILNRILKECNYRSVGYASWDFSTFDILMDGVPKSEDQGKGYRSFLNSVVALMLYEYFNKDDVFIKPGFLMIDTPLLGFDENEEGFDGETIKNGLYQYFLNHQGSGQVILVDNLNVIPQNIDFKARGVNVITYHKDEKDSHVYGFMPSWRKDLPKESK
jgi:predicted  nucleic acid-binding Zn-ribbon protein